MWDGGLDSSGLEKGLVAGYFEYIYDLSGLMKDREFFE
jgi:hypothetical protein